METIRICAHFALEAIIMVAIFLTMAYVIKHIKD